MRVLGIDPGTVVTGWGVVETIAPSRAAQHRHVASGVIKARGDLPLRLASIFEQVRRVLAEHRPDVLSLEKTFVSDNVQTALRLGEARGSVLVAAALEKVEICEYSPAEIKVAVVGYGRALKEQVQSMVARLLCLAEHPATDEADALAAALCHLQTHRLRNLAGDDLRSVHGRIRRTGRASAVRLAERRMPR